MKSKKKLVIFFIIVLFYVFSNAQYQFFPYYGKNKIQIGKQWYVYETKHFKFNFYTKHLEILNFSVIDAEDAYSKLSEFLGFSPEKKIPILLYQSHKDFEMTNLYPSAVPEPVMGFSEPIGNRVVIPAEYPPSVLRHLITHELTHIFQFNLLYGRHRQSFSSFFHLPLWIMEGFAEFIPGEWDPISLMIVRDAVVTGQIPQLTKYGDLRYNTASSRSPYDFGHLVYDYLYKEYGRTGLRKFWWNLKRFSFFRGKGIFKETFNLEYNVFNSKFERYLRKRFKKFFGRGLPGDYGLRISPEYPYSQVYSFSVSPSGETAAIVTANYKKYALTISLLDLKNGKVYKDITPGYSSKFENLYLKFSPEDGKSIVWDSKGDYIAFFGRYNYDYYLLFYSSIGKFLKRVKLKNLHEPSGIEISPDDKYLVFSAIRDAKRDLFLYRINDGKITRLTNSIDYEFSASFSKDGKYIVFDRMIGRYHQLFLLNLETKEEKQLTFEKTYHINPVFKDEKNILFSYYYKDAYNLAILNIETGKIKILTNLSTGVFYPQIKNNNIYYLGYSHNNFSLYRADKLKEIMVTTEKNTLGRREEKFIINKNKIRKYKKFEDIVVSGLPSVGFAVATDGTTYGGAYLNFSDTLNNDNITILAYSVMGFKNYTLSYVNLGHRLNYGVQLFSNTYFYYLPYQYWAADFYGYYSYKNALATRKILGATLSGIYPFSKFHRLSFDTGLYYQKEDLYYFTMNSPRNPFFNGYSIPFTLSLTGETTAFRGYGPYEGYTYNLSFTKTIPFSDSWRDAYAFQIDLRKYLPLGYDTLFAFRGFGAFSGGKNPYIFYGGGNNDIRSTYYFSVVGNNYFHLNAEFRFPLVHIALTPLGLLGPVRGVFFADLGGAWFNDEKFEFWDSFKNGLKDPVGSIGYGIEFFFGGYPIHIEWVYRTNFVDYSSPEVRMWIGFDF